MALPLVSPWLKPDQKQPYSTINARDDRIQTALHFQQRTAPFAFGSGAAVYTDSLLLRSHQSCVRADRSRPPSVLLVPPGAKRAQGQIFDLQHLIGHRLSAIAHRRLAGAKTPGYQCREERREHRRCG